MAKNITLLIVNASHSEAFEVEGIEITRGFKKELKLPMEKANKIVAALGSVKDVTISVVPETLVDAPQGYGQAELTEAKDEAARLQAVVVELTATVNDQQSVIESQAKTIAELETLVKAQEKPVTETPETQANDVAAPAKTSVKKAK